MTRPPPRSTLFPYTTLFRSRSSSASRPSSAIVRCRFARRTRRLHRSEEHTSELQSRLHLVCRLLLEKKKTSILDIHLFSDILPDLLTYHVQCNQLSHNHIRS